MDYVLESNNEYLDLYRRATPISDESKERIQRVRELFVREAILAHYQIEPFKAEIHDPELLRVFKEYKIFFDCKNLDQTEKVLVDLFNHVNEMLNDFKCGKQNLKENKNLDDFFNKYGFERRLLHFETFIEKADAFHILDTFRRSEFSRKITFGHPLNQAVLKKDYIAWALERGLTLPNYMIENVEPCTLPNLSTVDSVKEIDMGRLSMPVIQAFGCRLIAEVKRRIAIGKNDDYTITDWINSQLMKSFLKECCEQLLNGKYPNEKTLRNYLIGVDKRLESKKQGPKKKPATAPE